MAATADSSRATQAAAVQAAAEAPASLALPAAPEVTVAPAVRPARAATLELPDSAVLADPEVPQELRDYLDLPVRAVAENCKRDDKL